MAEYTFRVEPARAYVLLATKRHAQCSWCVATVREWPGGGQVDIQSDADNYAASWAAIGEGPFLEFLVGLEYDYFMRKAHAEHGQRFAFEESVQKVKNALIEMRRDRVIDKATAREEWDQLAHLNHTGDAGQFAFEALELAPKAVEHLELDPIARTDDPICRMFWEGPWATLCNIWRAELAGIRMPT